MSNAIARRIKDDAGSIARAMLADEPPEAVTRAAGRVARAFYSAVSAAKNPSAWGSVSPQSVAAAVAASVDTELYPGGPMPDVYLVPQSGSLDWRITHRGLATLCRREGYDVRPVPVHEDDHLVIEFGEVTEHRADPRQSPGGMADLFGVIVVVTHAETGQTTRLWTPLAVIEARRRTSRMSDRGPWRDWPVEMACKTAILYHASRGSLPVSGQMRRAMEAEVIEVVREEPRRRALPPPVVEDDAATVEAEPVEVSDAE